MKNGFWRCVSHGKCTVNATASANEVFTQPRCRNVDGEDGHESEMWLDEDIICPRCNKWDWQHDRRKERRKNDVRGVLETDGNFASA